MVQMIQVILPSNNINIVLYKMSIWQNQSRDFTIATTALPTFGYPLDTVSYWDKQPFTLSFTPKVNRIAGSSVVTLWRKADCLERSHTYMEEHSEYKKALGPMRGSRLQGHPLHYWTAVISNSAHNVMTQHIFWHSQYLGWYIISSGLNHRYSFQMMLWFNLIMTATLHGIAIKCTLIKRSFITHSVQGIASLFNTHKHTVGLAWLRGAFEASSRWRSQRDRLTQC